MPHLFAVAAIGVGVLAGLRALGAIARLTQEAAARAEQGSSQPEAVIPVPKDLGQLELDPATGQYRPARRH